MATPDWFAKAVNSKTTLPSRDAGGLPTRGTSWRDAPSVLFARRMHVVPATLGAGAVCFTIVSLVLALTKPGSERAAAVYAADVGVISWPVPAHLACLLLSFKQYYFQSNPTRRRFMMPTMYSSSLAVASYFLMERTPQLRLATIDAFGHFLYFRFVQWMHTTPAMLFQVAHLGDQPPEKLFWVQFFNQGMLVFGLLGHVVKPYALATALLTLSWISFALLMRLVHDMFLRITLVAKVQLARIENSEQLGPLTDAEAGDPVTGIERGRSAFHQSARTTVRMIRHTHALTLLLWVGFGINDALASSGVVPLSATEEAWSVLDVFAKVLFSSALSMTGIVSVDEAEKEEVFVEETKVAVRGRTAQQAREAMETQAERDRARIAELEKLSQEGWSMLVAQYMTTGSMPNMPLTPAMVRAGGHLPHVAEDAAGEASGRGAVGRADGRASVIGSADATAKSYDALTRGSMDPGPSGGFGFRGGAGAFGSGSRAGGGAGAAPAGDKLEEEPAKEAAAASPAEAEKDV